MEKFKVAVLANLKVNAPKFEGCLRTNGMTWIQKRQ